jgi:hypothetical protein
VENPNSTASKDSELLSQSLNDRKELYRELFNDELPALRPQLKNSRAQLVVDDSFNLDDAGEIDVDENPLEDYLLKKSERKASHAIDHLAASAKKAEVIFRSALLSLDSFTDI